MFKNAGLWEREEYVFGHKKTKVFILFDFMRGLYRICVLEMDGTND